MLRHLINDLLESGRSQEKTDLVTRVPSEKSKISSRSFYPLKSLLKVDRPLSMNEHSHPYRDVHCVRDRIPSETFCEKRSRCFPGVFYSFPWLGFSLKCRDISRMHEPRIRAKAHGTNAFLLAFPARREGARRASYRRIINSRYTPMILESRLSGSYVLAGKSIMPERTPTSGF